jgi:apolipoprotein N-acyltransferase
VLLHAAVFWCSFPQLVGGVAFDAGWLFAWWVPTTLLLLCDRLPVRRAALLGGFAGWLANTLLLYWIYVAAVRYGHAHPVLGVASVALLGCYGAIFSALFGAAVSWLPGRRASTPLVIAALWVCLDWLRTVLLTGFPWGTLGYALHEDAFARAWVPFVGVYGLSFVGALAGTALRDLLFPDASGRRHLGRGLVWLGAVALLHAGGALLRPNLPEQGGDSLRVGVVQGNIDQGQKWDAGRLEETLAVYLEGSREAVRRGAEIVIWPETAVPGLIEADGALAAQISRLAGELATPLVVGGVGVEGLDQARAGDPGALRYFDSAFLVQADGRIGERYDKSHLVPFGEYVPLRGLIGRFVSAVASGATSGDVTPGEAPRALRIPRAGGNELSIGVPICYELLFPDLVRRFAKDGATVLAGITNDAWYGKTGAPYQFLAITALRAAESGVWLVRAANTGVSALIDPTGRVDQQTGLFERGVLVGSVFPRPSAWPTTLYARFGDVFVAGCALVLSVPALRGLRRRRRGAAGDG